MLGRLSSSISGSLYLMDNGAITERYDECETSSDTCASCRMYSSSRTACVWCSGTVIPPENQMDHITATCSKLGGSI